MAEPTSGLYDPQPRPVVLRDLVERSRRRFEALSDAKLNDVLEDALYNERLRLEKQEAKEGEKARLDELARSLVRGTRRDRTDAGLGLVRGWAEEIHGTFDPRVYRFATSIMPSALTGLLSERPRPSLSRFFSGERRDLDIESRVLVKGNTELVKTLATESTLVLCPTHVSNLDSPLIGLALYLAGLPPFVYGAGLNLFSNAMMGWFMRRLGAYTVDRTKQAALYKDVLKDYSVRAIVTRHHSLFFPGGTRARSGHIERGLKKGLLGTAGAAWQELIEKGAPHAEVYILPMTLTFQLTLEANTLINDHLEREGGKRFIITDDEFAEARTVAAFMRRILDLDSSVILHFGDPIDCLGNPVPADRDERAALAKRRRRYVCDADGKVQWDEQRDRVYTERLGQALVRAYPKGTTVLSTHLVAWVAWHIMEEKVGSTDPYRILRVPEGLRRMPADAFLPHLAKAKDVVMKGALLGKWEDGTPATAEALLGQAIDRFGRYHRSHAVKIDGGDVFVEDAKLCLYYRNRLDNAGLLAGEPELHGGS